MSNPHPLPYKNYGNKGGRRLGYTYERDQLMRLRKIADRGIALIEAIMLGKVSEKEIEKYKVIEKALLKAMDKLQPDKRQTDIQIELKPIPLLHVLHHNSDEENIIDVEANPSLTGGDIGGEDDRG